ncbi:hypothetical protein DFH29DRAFT_1006069 [Suillus ampliporus]|nr:hypothetical protein DFH29DRAFT_1006069 [Suillus ampliporus]
MVIKGYPEDVLLPGEFHMTANKGITNLTLKETGVVVVALKAGTMRIKKVSEAMQAKLLTSKIPILEGAPPAADCIHGGGRRLFANDKSDCLGLPHAKPSAAATRRKAPTSKKKEPMMSHASPISLSDNSSSDANPSPIRPILKPPPSHEFKVVKLPKSQKKDEQKIIKKNIKKEVISLMSSEVSNARSGSEKPEDNDRTKSDSDYEGDSAASKKRKAKSEVTLQALKKRVPPSEASLPKEGLIQPAKRLHDGPTAQEDVKASEDLNDTDTAGHGAIARGTVEVPAGTEPAVAGQGAIAKVTAEAPTGKTGHADSVEPAAHVASNTLHADPVGTDPVTHAPSEDNTADPIWQPELLIRTDHPPSLQPELPPTLVAHHGYSEPIMDGEFNAKNHSMMWAHDAEVRPVMYDPRPRGSMPLCYGSGFTWYMQSEYCHDPRMPHPSQLPHGPQPRPRQPPHGPQPRQPSHRPQPQYPHGGYHDAPYRDPQDGYEGYVKGYWHPPSGAYFGPGGRYEHGYRREYPNEYPKDLEDGGRVP